MIAVQSLNEQYGRRVKRCGCVAKSTMAFRDEDGAAGCIRCGRRLPPARPNRFGAGLLAGARPATP